MKEFKQLELSDLKTTTTLQQKCKNKLYELMSKRITERVTLIHEKLLIEERCHLYQLHSFDRVHLASKHSLKPQFVPLGQFQFISQGLDFLFESMN